MRDKNIVFFHDNYVTNFNGSFYSNGSLNKKVVERYINYSKKLTLATREDKNRKIDKLSLLANENEILFYGLPNFRKFDFNTFKTLRKKIIQIASNNDVVIIRLPSIVGFIASYFAFKNNKNTIIELVGCPLDTFKLHSKIGFLLSFPLYFLTKYFVLKANNVLYVTSSFLQKRYPTNAKNIIGCSDVEIKIEKDILKNRIKKIEKSQNNKQLVVGMIGFLEAKYKGYDVALKAINKLVRLNNINIRLEIVGGGSDYEIKKLISKLNIEKNVSVIGSLSHPNEIFNWLDTVDIYIHPSRTEGLPRSLIEAMSRGCACIGSEVGGIPELLDSKYLHSVDNVNELFGLILYLTNVNNRLLNINDCFKRSEAYDSFKLNKKRNDFYLECIK